MEGAAVRDVRPARRRRVRDQGRPPRVPVPRARRAHDRGQPPGGRDHPRRRDAHHAGRDRAAAHGAVHPADARSRRSSASPARSLGLYLSYWLDVASGATIVLVQTGAFLVALAFGPRGLVARRRRAADLAVDELAAEARRMTDAPAAANDLVEALERCRLPADGAAARGRRAGRRARRPLHGRGARRRGARPAPGARAGDRLPGPRRCSRRSASWSGSTCPTATTRTSRASRPTTTTRSAPAADGRSTSTTPASRRSSRRSARRSGFRVTAHRLELFGLCAACQAGVRAVRACAPRASSSRSIAAALVAGACGGSADAGGGTGVPVVATTTILADLVAPGRRRPGPRREPRPEGRRGAHVRSHAVRHPARDRRATSSSATAWGWTTGWATSSATPGRRRRSSRSATTCRA